LTWVASSPMITPYLNSLMTCTFVYIKYCTVHYLNVSSAAQS